MTGLQERTFTYAEELQQHRQRLEQIKEELELSLTAMQTQKNEGKCDGLTTCSLGVLTRLAASPEKLEPPIRRPDSKACLLGTRQVGVWGKLGLVVAGHGGTSLARRR